MQESLQKQVDLYKEKKDLLTVRSPIDGKIITWQLEERLINRPVEKSQVLMTVADPTKNWQLEVHMPEDRMGHIKRAQQKMGDDLTVDYILATDPSRTLHGKVSEVHEAAEVQGDEGNTVLVRVKIDEHDFGPEVRPGIDRFGQNRLRPPLVGLCLVARRIGVYPVEDSVPVVTALDPPRRTVAEMNVIA